MQNTRH